MNFKKKIPDRYTRTLDLPCQIRACMSVYKTYVLRSNLSKYEKSKNSCQYTVCQKKMYMKIIC